MNYLKIRKILSIALFGATGIFGVQSHIGFAHQRNVVIKQNSAINPAYSPPILASSVLNPLKSSLGNVLARMVTRLTHQNIDFKQQALLHISFFYLSQLPSQQELNEMQRIVKEAMIALNNQEISFTLVPQLALMGNDNRFVVVRLQPSQGAIDFFNYVRAGLIKAGIAHVDYPKFEAHISLGKFITPGSITQQQLAQVLREGTQDLQNIPGSQLQFSVSSCMLTQNLTKQSLVSFEFQQSIKPTPVAIQAKAAQKVARHVKVAAKQAPRRPVVKQQLKVKPQPKVAPKAAPKAKVAVNQAPKRSVVKQQSKVKPQPKVAQRVAPKARVIAKPAPKRPVVKQQPKVAKKRRK